MIDAAFWPTLGYAIAWGFGVPLGMFLFAGLGFLCLLVASRILKAQAERATQQALERAQQRVADQVRESQRGDRGPAGGRRSP